MSKKLDESLTQHETLLIGLSGPSSSGKTTLARLLRNIFHIEASEETHGNSVEVVIVHEDDFWKTDAEVPFREFTSAEHGTRTLQDWDCVESLDLPYLERTLRYIKENGRLPPDLVSKEDQNEVKSSLVTDDVVAQYRHDIVQRMNQINLSGDEQKSKSKSKSKSKHVTVYILDGFLMYPPPPPPQHSSSESTNLPLPPITSPTTTPSQQQETKPPTLPPLPPTYGTKIHTTSPSPLHTHLHTITTTNLNLRLFLPCTRAQAIHRRADRSGYVTIEGFWEDPPGYVEDVVWVHYRALQGWIFGKDASITDHVDEGIIEEGRRKVLEREDGLVVGPVGNGVEGMREVLGWGVEMVWRVLGGSLT